MSLVLIFVYWFFFFFFFFRKLREMLVLFETPAGFALFKVLNEGKLSKVEVCMSNMKC